MSDNFAVRIYRNEQGQYYLNHGLEVSPGVGFIGMEYADGISKTYRCIDHARDAAKQMIARHERDQRQDECVGILRGP